MHTHFLLTISVQLYASFIFLYSKGSMLDHSTSNRNTGVMIKNIMGNRILSER